MIMMIMGCMGRTIDNIEISTVHGAAKLALHEVFMTLPLRDFHSGVSKLMHAVGMNTQHPRQC